MAYISLLPSPNTAAAGCAIPHLKSVQASGSLQVASVQFPRRLSISACSSSHDSGDVHMSPMSSGLASRLRSLIAAAAAAAVLTSQCPAMAQELELTTYYGTAASASSYGGYGGNASKKDSAEYVYDVPGGWKERAISKVEKGTNGTDSEFYNPKKKTEKTYLTYLAGFRKLPPKDDVLNNIALSDVDLQDLLASADSNEFTERTVDGQKYYDFEIDSYSGHALISVTCAKNKLYAHFVNAAPAEWSKDKALLQQIHESFKTVGRDPLSM